MFILPTFLIKLLHHHLLAPDSELPSQIVTDLTPSCRRMGWNCGQTYDLIARANSILSFGEGKDQGQARREQRTRHKRALAKAIYRRYLTAKRPAAAAAGSGAGAGADHPLHPGDDEPDSTDGSLACSSSTWVGGNRIAWTDLRAKSGDVTMAGDGMWCLCEGVLSVPWSTLAPYSLMPDRLSFSMSLQTHPYTRWITALPLYPNQGLCTPKNGPMEVNSRIPNPLQPTEASRAQRVVSMRPELGRGRMT